MSFFCTSAVAEGDADGETTRLLNSRMTGAGGVSTSRSAAVSGRGLTLCVEYLLASEMNMDNHVKGFFQHGSVRKESCRHGGLPGGDGTYPNAIMCFRRDCIVTPWGAVRVSPEHLKQSEYSPVCYTLGALNFKHSAVRPSSE